MDYATQVQGKLDVVNAPIWSTENLASGSQQLVWFSTVYQDKVNGNLQAQGIMPRPYAFLVRAIRFVPLNWFYFETAVDATNLIADLENVVNRSYITIRIGEKNFGEYPTHMLPAGSGLCVYSASSFGYTAATNKFMTLVSNGVPHVRNTYVLAKPLFIESLQPFSVRLQTVQGGITFTSTGLTQLTLQLILDGEFFRPVS
jgi:hypothetical protein